MSGSRGSGFDTRCLYLQIFIFFNLVEKNSFTVKKFSSVAKMASTVYETEICVVELKNTIPVYSKACSKILGLPRCKNL